MRRAVALPTVLFMVALVGALVVGAAFLGRTAAAGARLAQSAAVATWPAESALVRSIARWDGPSRASQAVGAIWAETGPDVAVAITRLGPSLYLCAATFTGREPYRLPRRMSVLVLTDSVGVRPLAGRAWTALP